MVWPIPIIVVAGKVLAVPIARWVINKALNGPDEPPGECSFRIPAGSSYTITQYVKAGGSINYQFSSDRDIDFQVINPYADPIVTRKRSVGDEGGNQGSFPRSLYAVI